MNTDFIRQRAYSFLLQLLLFKKKQKKTEGRVWKDAEVEEGKVEKE